MVVGVIKLICRLRFRGVIVVLGLLILFEVEYCLTANRSGDVFVSVSSCSVGLFGQSWFSGVGTRLVMWRGQRRLDRCSVQFARRYCCLNE